MNATPLLSMRHVSRTFATRRSVLGRPRDVVQAVTDVSIDVQAGSTLGIVGESGSGKSTLGRLALRVIEADQGEISLLGQDLSSAFPPRPAGAATAAGADLPGSVLGAGSALDGRPQYR